MYEWFFIKLSQNIKIWNLGINLLFLISKWVEVCINIINKDFNLNEDLLV